MKAIINHITRWNVWRKRNVNSIFYKILVLFGIIKSPTLAFTLTSRECDEIQKAMEEAMEKARRALEN